MKLRFFDILALIFSLAVFLGFTAFGRSLNQDDGYVIIEDSQSQYLYPLSIDQMVTLHGPVGDSVVEIKDGEAHFHSSDCADGLCVQMAPIRRGGDWAACLPNQVFIYIGGFDDDKEVDAGVY
ncbi:MAG: NusG domain II-containing protein [Spirochaetales bacterium]|nr:NusG domain II-containing protein [Spirochaetales bacterium]